MKAIKYGTTVWAGIVLFFLTACNNSINEMIPPNDNFITGFKLDGQKSESKIGKNTITIPWYEGIPDGPVSYQVDVSPKASLLPVTEGYIQAAFPEEDPSEVIESIDAAKDTELTSLIKGLIKRTPNFKIPPPQPVNFSEPVIFLVISGRDGKIRRYTTNITVNVRFESNGGRRVPAQTVKHGGTATRPEDPDRTGYTFDNWYGDEGLTGEYDFATPLFENITLYAKWELYTYTVTYDRNGATGDMDDTPFTYGVAQNLPLIGFTPPDNCTFSGWARTATGRVEYTDGQSVSNLTATDGDIVTLFAIWTLNQYTVTFNTNGGSSVPSQTVSHGDGAGRPANPTKTGYTFEDWYDDYGLPYDFSTPVTGNTDLYAQWNPITYTVTYNKNAADAAGDMPDSDFTYGESQNLRTNTFTRTGYTFAGWATASAGAVAFTGGQSVSDLTTTAGATVTLWAVWVLDGTQTYTVIYNANGGSGSMANSTFSVGVPQTLRANTFTRTGYTFSGWAETAAGAAAYTNGQSVTDLAPAGGAVTLFAIWTLNQYTVTFNTNGGSSVPSQTVDYGGTAGRPANPTRDGYTFGNWYSDYGLTSVYNFSTPVNGNITLYAKWLSGNHGDQGDYGPVNIGVTVKSPDSSNPPNSPNGTELPDDEKIIISRTGTGYPKMVTLTADDDGYTFIEWHINGTNITGNEDSFSLNATNSYYNNLGEHYVTITVIKDNKLYSRTIPFIVVP
jgi:uncharacterized repeat protein (TIGR02543 family)